MFDVGAALKTPAHIAGMVADAPRHVVGALDWRSIVNPFWPSPTGNPGTIVGPGTGTPNPQIPPPAPATSPWVYVAVALGVGTVGYLAYRHYR